eukprot:COSAG02_NODE_14001_length_1322_cov_1.668847_2_plen_92_part_00
MSHVLENLRPQVLDAHVLGLAVVQLVIFDLLVQIEVRVAGFTVCVELELHLRWCSVGAWTEQWDHLCADIRVGRHELLLLTHPLSFGVYQR